MKLFLWTLAGVAVVAVLVIARAPVLLFPMPILMLLLALRDEYKAGNIIK